MTKTRRCSLILVAMLICLTVVAGCSLKNEQAPSPTPPADPKPGEAEQAESKLDLTLYFADKDAQYLVAEKREVVRTNEPIPELIVGELIKGPKNQDLSITIPEGTQTLPPINITNGIATVNFSKELKTKHWGGSAGEMLTVYSIVSSLSELEGVNKVQILIDGKKEETLAGHLTLSEPIAPDSSIINKTK